MDINNLLNKTVKCECGMEHKCDIKSVIIENDAINRLPSLVENYKNIVVTADKNTFSVCGEKVVNALGDKLETLFVYDDEGILVPDEEAIEKLNDKVSDKTDLIIGIGSGVINDLCKYVSFKNTLPYFIVATAPSMDGYASVGAAMIIGNMKITYSAHVPTAIIADTAVIKDAPIDMIKSGYGDIIGKYSALNDWKLSHVVNDEYICDYVYKLTMDMVKKVRPLAKGVLNRDEESIKTLMEALVVVGIAMSYVGNSRPASGSEHHLSHFYEVTGIMTGMPYFLHGIDVMYSTYITQLMREDLLKIDEIGDSVPFNREKWLKIIDNIYYDAAEGVIAQQNKLGWYDKDMVSIYKAKWNEIKEVLSDTPSSDEIRALLNEIELPYDDFMDMYGDEKVYYSKWYAKDLKDRYTVLWMYYEILHN